MPENFKNLKIMPNFPIKDIYQFLYILYLFIRIVKVRPILTSSLKHFNFKAYRKFIHGSPYKSKNIMSTLLDPF